MALSTSAMLAAFFALLLHLANGNWPGQRTDKDLLEFPLNLEYLETEFFLYGAFGYGLDRVEPAFALNGPPPVGAQKANLSQSTNDIIQQFGLQEVGHLRALKKMTYGFPRPLLNLSASSFAAIMNSAFGETLKPYFDPYISDINYLLASYVIPYVGLTGYVGALPNLQTPSYRGLVAGLLAVESGQDAVIRTLLYQHKDEIVIPYRYTVEQFTDKISALRNNLGHAWVKDEGIVVAQAQGAEGKVTGNILAGDSDSKAYARTPEEILGIVYGTGSVMAPGGLFPRGAGGAIAESYYPHH